LLLTFHSVLRKPYTELSIGASYQIFVTKDLVAQTPLKTGTELGCSRKVSCSCSTSGTRRVNLITNPVIVHEERTGVIKPYTELSIGASYQIFVHLATEFQRRRILRN
jgi:hypothetical protein